MRAGIRTTSLGSVAALAAALAIAQPVAAQDSGSVSDYRLPEPKQTSRPTVQGPVDPDNPIGTPAGAPAPTPTPAPAPTIALPPPTQGATPRATPSRPRSIEAPRTASPSPVPSPSADLPAPATPSEEVPPAPSSSGQPLDLPASAEPASSDDGPPWLLPGLAGAALLGLGGFLFLRRRRPKVEDEPVAVSAAPAAPPPPAPVPSAAKPIPAPAATPKPTPARQPIAAPPAPAPLAVEPLALATSFTAKAVRLSLVYATLQYELDVTNTGTAPLHRLQVRADLASAHGSIPTHEQLAPSPDSMEARHAIEALAPGETATLKGDVRVPLQQIRPVTKGTAQFLVPLVRFCILAPDGAAVRRVFTAGPHDPGSNAIASVRLDAGPRNLRDLLAREIEAARSFALDPAGAQG